MTQTNNPDGPIALSATAGWALYRPDGTMMHVYCQGDMSPEREDSILSRAWDEIKPDTYHFAGTPIPSAVDVARKLGYRVVPVTITPNTSMTPTEYRTIRKQLGLTQAGLATILGETRETISRREKSASIAKRDEFALLWLAHKNTEMSIHDLLSRAEIDYRDAVCEYDKAVEESVSSFYEHNTCSYFRGVCSAYKNILNKIHTND